MVHGKLCEARNAVLPCCRVAVLPVVATLGGMLAPAALFPMASFSRSRFLRRTSLRPGPVQLVAMV